MSLRGFRRQLAEVDAELFTAIARRREAPDLVERADILSLLLQARHEDGDALSDRELRDELMTLLVAGHETTAAALSWALTEVAGDPGAQARLADGEPGLAEAAIAETLRLHALDLRPARTPRRRIDRRGIVLVPPRGGPVIATARRAGPRPAFRY